MVQTCGKACKLHVLDKQDFRYLAESWTGTRFPGTFILTRAISIPLRQEAGLRMCVSVIPPSPREMIQRQRLYPECLPSDGRDNTRYLLLPLQLLNLNDPIRVAQLKLPVVA
jgi:hypothetical protein